MAIRIITDSAADYSQAEIERRKIICVPMTVNFGMESYRDGVDITKEIFYEKLIEGEYFPQTAQPSPASFLDVFEEAKEAGDTVIAVLISSALSGTYQSAHLAKGMAEYDEIYIVDSKHATLGMRFLVDRAVQLREKGKTAPEIVAEIEELIPRLTLFAGLDTLEYLYKGGRIPKSVANIGKLANVKPLITITQEGKVDVCGKQVGNRHACRAIRKMVAQNEIDYDYPVYFIYSYDKKNVAFLAHSMQEEGLLIDEPRFREIGPTIGTHIGTNAYGLVYIRQMKDETSEQETQEDEREA